MSCCSKLTVRTGKDHVSTYKDKELVVKRDGTVLYDGNAIGRVYADPADTRVQQRDWCYSHVSGTTLKDLHPDWGWPRTAQVATDKRWAARSLADLHRHIQQEQTS
jgi:hypothetical protein